MNDQGIDGAEGGDPRLDPLLAAAFGPSEGRGAARNAAASDTIGVALAAIRDSAQRTTLRLRDTPSDHGIRSDPARAALSPSERYEAGAEIARGGMGIVYRGQDRDLGREVAIKVLQDRHARNPGMLQRFIEEAQIIGQLQHPGFVPVHELAVGKDGRPFFAMKYVEGTTLAAMLAGRSDPNEDQLRFVRVLEQICQAVAYAHAHGVVHRDLKPHNVMVGAFGEVVVLDWGLAKVLGRRREEAESAAVPTPAPPDEASSRSQPHTVLGTPAYCSPEQARGDVGATDVRTDVFGLGAILCEILTGYPPYRGHNREELLAQAMAASLGDAMARLDSREVDQVLAGLARACLAPDQELRPHDAKAVASAIAAHLASVASRAQAAEVAAAEQRVARQAAEAHARIERKGRRLTTALAVVVIGVLLLGGTSLWWLDAAAQKHRSERSRAALGAIQEAQTHAATARAQGAEATTPWIEALSAAKRAAAFADRDVDQDVATTARSVLQQIDADQAAAGRVRAQLARDREFLERRARQNEGLEGDASSSHRAMCVALESNLRKYGLDLFTLSATDAAQRITESAIRSELLVTIDKWTISLRSDMTQQSRESADRLAAIVGLADPDPWRMRLRGVLSGRSYGRQWSWQMLPQLEQLANEVDVSTQPSFYIRVCAGAFPSSSQTAISLLERASLYHPGRLAWELATRHASMANHQEAVRWATAGVSAFPESHFARIELGVYLIRAGRSADALEVFRHASIHWPDKCDGHYWSGVVLERLGRAEVAAAAFTTAQMLIQNDSDCYHRLDTRLQQCDDSVRRFAVAKEWVLASPNDPMAHCVLGDCHLRRKEYSAAAQELRKAIELGCNDECIFINCAVALLNCRDFDAALEVLRHGLLVRPESAEVTSLLSNALLNQGASEEARAMARRAIELDDQFGPAYAELARVCAHDGGHEQACDLARKAISLQTSPREEDHRILVFALHQARRLEEAEVAAREFIRIWPEAHFGHNALGCIHHVLEQFVEAEMDFRRAVQLAQKFGQKSAELHSNLYKVLWKLGRNDEALAELREAVRMEPDSVRWQAALGVHLRENQAFEESVQVFQALAKREPNDVTYRWHLTQSLKEAGALGQALDELRVVFQLAPALDAGGYTLTEILWGFSDSNAAFNVCREMLTHVPDNTQVREVLVKLLWRRGQLREALQTLRDWPKQKPKGKAYLHFVRLLERGVRYCDDNTPTTRPESSEQDVLTLLARADACRAQERVHGEAQLLWRVATGDHESVRHYYTTLEMAAATACVRASNGEGKDTGDLPEPIRVDLRRKALELLVTGIERVKSMPAEQNLLARCELAKILVDPGFASVRDAAALDRLDDAERRAWIELWRSAREAHMQRRD